LLNLSGGQTHQNAEVKWGKEQQVAFKKLKELITHAYTLAYFNVNSRRRIMADASPVGLGSEWRVIGYAFRRLSDVWACEHLSIYVFGRDFDLETDHKPLEYIYSPKLKPSTRVKRLVLRLQAYHFKVVYRPGKTKLHTPCPS